MYTYLWQPHYGLLTGNVKLRVAQAPGIPGMFYRHRHQRDPRVSDRGIHHGTCVTAICQKAHVNIINSWSAATSGSRGADWTHCGRWKHISTKFYFQVYSFNIFVKGSGNDGVITDLISIQQQLICYMLYKYIWLQCVAITLRMAGVGACKAIYLSGYPSVRDN